MSRKTPHILPNKHAPSSFSDIREFFHSFADARVDPPRAGMQKHQLSKNK